MARTTAFEAHSEEYDAWFDEHTDAFRAELAAVRALLPAGGRRVEVGVGSGIFAAPLGIGLGVEPAEAMAARARQRGIEVLCGVAEALPLDDAAFDAVLMVTTICFVDDPARALAEAWRVLVPGGVLVLGFVDRDSTLGRSYERKRAHSRFYGEAEFYTAAELGRLLEASGFSELAARQTLLAQGDRLAVRAGSGQGAFVVLRGRK